MICEKCGCEEDNQNEFEKLACDKISKRCGTKFSKSKRMNNSDPRGVNFVHFKDNKEFSRYVYNIWKEQKGLCKYTNYPMALENDRLCVFSLDRVDSTKKYEKDNIVLCLNLVNIMKQGTDLESFGDLCLKIAINCFKENKEYNSLYNDLTTLLNTRQIEVDKIVKENSMVK